MRDDAGADVPVAHFPLGSYDPVEIGPGFTARTDEVFVKYNWNETVEHFEDERRYLNATALGKLGGVGLNTTHELSDEVAKWITTEALADDVGRRIVNHFFSGLIVWRIRSHYPHPELELGDAVSIITDQFVGRNPITDAEIRGPLAALAVVVRVGDFWGTELDLWVPGYEYIVVGDGTTGLSGFGIARVRRIAAEEFGGGASGRVRPAGTGSPETFTAALDLPHGSIITGMETRGARRNAGDTVVVDLFGKWQYLGSPPLSVLIGTLATHTHDADANNWTVETTTLGTPSTVSSTGPDTVRVTLEAASSVSDAQLAWVDISYIEPIGGTG
jgi:hypothetical protein